MQKLQIKKAFIERYKELTEFDEFEIYLNKFIRKTIRINTLKSDLNIVVENLSYLNLKKIPWYNYSFWVESEKRDLGNLIEHKLGYIFVQEAASIIPSIALNPKEKDLVLDMCASPGAKTSHIAELMNNKGLIIANEKNYSRLSALNANINRCGVMNSVITLMDARNINYKFDKILLDAPCTSSGTIRGITSNSRYLINSWNLSKIISTSNLQKKLILRAYENLNENGNLVYSVCSLEPEECEEVIQYLLENTDAKIEKINLDIKSKINLNFNNKEYSKEIKKCIKLWPQFYDTEGFFIAKIKKL